MMNFERLVVAAVSAALMVGEAQAFWGKGHLIVAREAEQILSKEAPAVFSKALTELHTLQDNHPDVVVNERDHSFTECATFADDIKLTFGAFQTNWHFIDQPYLDEPDSKLDDFDFHTEDVNVVSALTDFTAFLKKDPSAGESQYIQRIAQEFPKLDDRRSFVLRMVIHYVGDIHQPLHAVAEVDHRFPEGDQGGNLQKLPDAEGTGVGDLHAIWDSVIYQYPGYETMPFDEDEWEWYSAQAEKIIAANPTESEKVKPQDFSAWAAEDFEIAPEFVYKGFTPGEEPSDEYKKRALAELEMRMAYGGRRLAELIKSIYGGDADSQRDILFLQE